ncbi:hypothetical protein GCM10025857_05020 [Alicyclobacillus contaminans]|nr:hypothetical protein GCM10025857_05020 [Alicyclobacillus contaminans]
MQAISLVLMWIGGLEIVASFLVKEWFQFETHLTPVFFLVLLLGIALYVVSRVV